MKQNTTFINNSSKRISLGKYKVKNFLFTRRSVYEDLNTKVEPLFHSNNWED